MSSPTVLKVTEPEFVEHVLYLQGAGASVPTVVRAAGVTLVRNGVGDITVTFKEAPGEYVGHTEGFDANTVTDVDGWSVVVDKDGGSATTVRFTIVSDTPAAADLPVNSWLLLKLHFCRAKGIRG